MDEKFRNLVAGILKIEKGRLTEDATTETVPEWDSLNHWTVIGELEKEYGIEFTMEEATEFINLGHIYQILLEKTGQ